MSRTYRQIEVHTFILDGVKYSNLDVSYRNKTLKGSKELYKKYFKVMMHLRGRKEVQTVTREGLNRDTPGRAFKYPRRRCEKAKAKQAVRVGRDPEIVKNSDKWDYY